MWGTITYSTIVEVGDFRRFSSTQHFASYTAENLFLLVLSILAMESAHSIRFLYRHFLSGITEKSLTAFYYACSYGKVDYSEFMHVAASMVRRVIACIDVSRTIKTDCNLDIKN